ncbi:MAG: LysR family transcriptional regulator [Tissierellia bacterium]|nr:LysR family transcriptional regulator [Tissierellia bacterium]
MDLFSMKCYLSVAKHLNFSMAAKEMFISQPAMSTKMNLLEKKLDVKLLKRSRQKVELTEAGKYMQKEFAYLIDHYEKAKIQAQNIANKNAYLSIGYHGPAEWANINNRIKDFHKLYPHIELNVVVGGWGPLTRDVINGKLDLLFDEKSETDGISSLETVFLFRDYAAVAVSKQSPIAKYQKASPEFLKTENVIMSNNKSASISLKKIVERLTSAGFDMENANLVDEYETTIAMAATGLGIAPIPRSFKVKNSSVTYVDIDSEKVYQDFVLTWSKYNFNPSIQLFRDYCLQLRWE